MVLVDATVAVAVAVVVAVVVAVSSSVLLECRQVVRILLP